MTLAASIRGFRECTKVPIAATRLSHHDREARMRWSEWRAKTCSSSHLTMNAPLLLDHSFSLTRLSALLPMSGRCVSSSSAGRRPSVMAHVVKQAIANGRCRPKADSRIGPNRSSHVSRAMNCTMTPNRY